MPIDQSGLISPYFDFLIEERGFEATISRLLPESFGNAFVILGSDDFRVRLSRDRGDIYVEIGGTGESAKWYDLNLLWVLIERRDLDEFAPVDVLARFLKEHFVAITKCLSKENISTTSARLDELIRQRVRAMFPGAVRDEGS